MNNVVTLGEIFAKAQDSLTPSFNSVQFEADVDNLSKAETENLLGTIQAEIIKGGDYDMLTEMRSIALDHIADIEKAVYADNAQNRKLGRVGQEYGGKGSRGGKTDEENGGRSNGNTEDKEAVQNKKWFIKKLKSEGANSNTSHFMSKNESYFKDVLKKHGFDSFDDFEDWGMDHDDDKDIEKYNKIFTQCVNKIPASKF